MPVAAAITPEELETVIAAVHATPHRLVLEFAGAGAQALAWLHGVGGSSRTILEATDRYAPASLIGAIGFRAERFTSLRVAVAMAAKAYDRAHTLAGPGLPVIGIGSTATIATDRAKRGDHRCCAALEDAFGITTYALTLDKGLRTRRQEEEMVSLLIIRALAEGCGVPMLPELPLAAHEAVETHFEPAEPLARLVAEAVGWLALAPDGQMTTGTTLPNLALLSGAFNPLHEGHRRLAKAAAETLGQEVSFELPLINADKAPISPSQTRHRAAQFAGFATVLLTRAPLFDQKAALFPKSVFIIGADTAERIVQPRFYDGDPARMRAAFSGLREAGCRFLVAGRRREGKVRTLADLELPADLRDLFEGLPVEKFEMDISSTAIREGRSSR